MRTETTDIIIIGAGPAGLLMANLLGAMGGIDAVVVERSTTSVSTPRAVSIDDESMRVLQAAGISDDVAAITTKGYGSYYRGPSGSVFATVKPFAKEYGFDKRNAFDQPQYEALLQEKISRFDQISARYGTEMLSFSQDENGVSVRVKPKDSEEYEIRCKYLVASDGARSSIRKTLGIKLEGSTFSEPWLIVDMFTTKNRGFHTEVFCDPARPCITLPGPEGIRRYEFMLRLSEDQEDAVREENVRTLLAAVGPDKDEPIRRAQVYTFHARIAKKWRVGRVFLAGDAAHLTPPFAGQGMNSGVRDVHNLSWKLAEALNAGPEASEALLDSYETERKPHAWSLIELALRMGKVMMPTSKTMGFLTRTAFRVLGLYGPARDYVAQMKYKPKPRFESGLIWHDAKPRKASIVGQMIPQPVVEMPDRQYRLLDEILPDQPVLLVYSKTPDQVVDDALLASFRIAGVAVVGITPEDTKPVDSKFVTARDQSRFLSGPPYRAYQEHAFLLRRDRYIAAAEPVEHLARLLTRVSELVPAISS